MKFIKRYWDTLLLVAIMVALIVTNVSIVVNCDGTPVRGLFSMECIAEPQSNQNK